MARGTPPRDQEFLEMIKAMEEDSLRVYPLPDPDSRVKGLYQHPLQKVVRNYGAYNGKKFHSWRWLDRLYVVRLQVPNEEAALMKVPTQGAKNESQQGIEKPPPGETDPTQP